MIAKIISLRRDEEGSALIEAAVVMPLLLSLFVGVFEFSWYFYNQQLVVAGVRDAARYMTRIALTDGNRDPCAQKDLNGVPYTTDAANIATTARTASGGLLRVTGWKAEDVVIACLPSPALDSGTYADGSSAHDDRLGRHQLRRSCLRALLDPWREGAEIVLHAPGALPGARLMPLKAIARFIGDEDGGPLVEVAVILPLLITFLFGGVDFLNAFYQWNAAAKAVEVGARIAAVSDPVASGLNGLAADVLDSTVALGSPMPDFEIACDGGMGSCDCVSGACSGMGAYSAEAMGLIVYGRGGKTNCGVSPSQYFSGMCDVFPQVLPKYVSIDYAQTGLGFAGRGSGPVPTITVSLNAPGASSKLPFRFFFLPFAAIPIPSVATTVTGEALSSAAAD